MNMNREFIHFIVVKPTYGPGSQTYQRLSLDWTRKLWACQPATPARFPENTVYNHSACHPATPARFPENTVYNHYACQPATPVRFPKKKTVYNHYACQPATPARFTENIFLYSTIMFTKAHISGVRTPNPGFNPGRF
jgi:hypothetical protein